MIPFLVHSFSVYILYLKKAPKQGLLYEDRRTIQIFGYYDAYWECLLVDRQSITVYCVFLGWNIIS